MYFLSLILLCLTIGPHNTKKSDFTITVLSAKKKVLVKEGVDNIQKIKWSEQCYELKPGNNIEKAKISEGRVEFRFKGRTIYSANLFPYGSSAAHPYPYIFSAKWKMTRNDHSFCVMFEDSSELKKQVIANTELKKYFLEKGILEE